MTSLPAIMQVRPSGPTGARIMIVGECPGEQEVLKGEPFVGASGVELTKMLHEAGIMRSECFITNVARSRPFANDIMQWVAQSKKEIAEKSADPTWSWVGDRFVAAPIAQGIELLRKEINLVQPNVIIAFGNIALWALTGHWGVTDWRGSVLPCGLVQGPKVVPSYHPAAVLRNWSWRAASVQDLRRAAKESKSRELVKPEYRFIIRPDYATVIRVINEQLERLAKGPIHLSIDIETRAGHIACIGFSWSKTEAICIPLMDIRRREGYWSEDEEVGVLMALQTLLTHPNLEGSGQNFLYDAQYFWRHIRFKPRIWMDTMIAWHVCYAGQPKALDYQASLICESYRFWKNDGKEWNTKGMGEEQLWSYNCEDCVRTFEIAESHRTTIPTLGLDYPFEFQMTMFWLVLDTMIRGVRFDQARRSEFALMLQDEIAKRDQWFIDVLGHPLKPSSGKQMKALFYDDLKLPVQKNRKTGNPSLDDEALNKLAVKEPLIQPIVRRISEWRSLGVFFSTFVQAPLDRDNRMRCSYNVAGTDTFRFSSSENAFGSGCVPADAEVLTRDGWQSIATVTEGQYIAQWDNGSIIFVPATPYKTQYKGSWYIGAGEQFNVCLTAEHRVLLQDKYLQRSFELPAKQAARRSNVVLPLGGQVNGPLTISCPKLLVAVLADGSYEGTVIRISFTKQRKIDRLLRLFTEYGIEWWENASKPGYRRFVFRPPSDWPTEKRWGWWVTGLRKEVAEEMLEECRYWDGTDRGTSFWFFSADREQAEIVATLAHLCGRAATIRRQEQNEGSYSDTIMWVVNVKPRGYARLQSKHWTTQPYEGEVYCVTVPSSYWLMRYRGKISVTGNTNLQNIPKGGEEADGLELPNVRSLFLPDAGKIIFDTDLSSADLRIVVWESDEPEMKQILADGNNPYIMIAREFYRDPTIQKKLPNGTEHPKYRTFKSLAHGCVTAGHEVLTPTGWVCVENYEDGTPIMTCSAEGKSWFEVPSHFMRDLGVHFHSIEGQSANFEFTWDHRMPYTVDSADRLQIRSVSDIPSSARIPYTTLYEGGKATITQNCARLVAAFQADGTVDAWGNVRFHFKKNRKIIRMRKLLLSYPSTESMYSDGTTSFYIPHQAADFAAYGKTAGAYLLDWSGEALDAFLEELRCWDGWSNETVLCHVTSVDEEHCKWLQTVARLRNKGSQVSVQREARENRQTLYKVSLNNRKFLNLVSTKRTNYVTEPQAVYCPTVSTGMFLLRRGTCIVVSGNTHYLGSPRGLAMRLGLSTNEVERVQNWYFGRFPRIREWQEHVKDTLRKHHYVTNAFGYRKFYFDRIDDDVFREAAAWIPQSSVALYINHIWARFVLNIPGLEILLQVHDSLVGQFDKAYKDFYVKRMAEEAAKVVLPYADPLVIPLGVKFSENNWGECA